MKHVIPVFQCSLQLRVRIDKHCSQRTTTGLGTPPDFNSVLYRMSSAITIKKKWPTSTPHLHADAPREYVGDEKLGAQAHRGVDVFVSSHQTRLVCGKREDTRGRAGREEHGRKQKGVSFRSSIVGVHRAKVGKSPTGRKRWLKRTVTSRCSAKWAGKETRDGIP